MLIVFVLVTSSSVWAQSPCDALPVIQIDVTNNTPCLGEEITLTASGGVTYNWNKGISNGVGFTPASSDTFQVVVTDTIGCIDTAEVAIEVLPLPDVKANASSLNICLGDSVLLNAVNAASFNWISPAISNNSYYTPSSSGTSIFSVEGTGANGCVNTSQVIVVVNDVPAVPVLDKPEVSTCLNVPFESTITGTATGRVIWYKDVALTEKHGEQNELPLDHTIEGKKTYWAVALNGGCYSEAIAASAEVFALPVVSAGDDIVVNAGDRGVLNATASGNVASSSWWPSVNLEDPSALTTDFVAVESAEYTVKVVDENNCIGIDKLMFKVNTDLIISNVMTPNGDGDNDVWKIYPESTLATCRVRLYDGFGRTMIYQDGYSNNWNGTYQGNKVPDGDYYYHITCTGGFSTKGTLTILR